MIPQGQVKIIGNYSYNLKHCLGEGAYGKVYQGQDTGSSNKVAIKKLDLRNFEKDTYLRNQIISEIEILKKFNHRNIVKFIDLISTQRSLYIITEFCKDGDLREIMARKRFGEQEAWKVLKQIVNGFKELVSNAIIHRDLKPANILSHEGTFKIADFGFAKYVDNFANQLLRSCVGSPLYMAPQILARKPYSTKCDIWSLGIIFYEMVYQDVPWKGRDERDLLKNILSVPLSWKKSGFSIGAKSEEFLRKSLTIEETERISWEKVFEMFEVNGAGGGGCGEKLPLYQQPASASAPGSGPSTVQQQQQQQLPSQQYFSSSSQTNRDNRKKSIFTQGQGVAVGGSGPSQQPSPPAPASLLRQQHQEIVFRNFVVCIELFSRYQQLRVLVSGRNLNLEKLMMCLSKSNMTMQAALVQGYSSIGGGSPQLRRESEYYSQFHGELVEMLTRNGQLSHCERELDVLNLRDGSVTLSDAEMDRVQTLIHSLVKSVRQFTVTELLEEFRKTHQTSRPNLLALDNLVDIVMIHRKVSRQQEVDYDQMNEDKAEEEDSRRLMEKVQEKIRSI